jgi:hypothetical protein
MHSPLATLTLFAMLVQQPAGRAVTLHLPRALRAGESATLEVTLGVVPRSAQIEVTTRTGRHLGTISPYGIRAGAAAGTYTVPIPADAITGRRVCVVLTLHANGKSRAPAKNEVKKVSVGITR